MAYTPYYAPYYRPMNYYNPIIPQDAANMQNQQPIQQPQQMPMQTPIQQMQMVQPALTNDMIWVLSEVEATSFPVAPNNSVTLWDKNKDTVYIKSVNAQGIPSMRVLDYTERTAENVLKSPEKHVCQCGKDFVRKEQFEALQSEIAHLRGELDEMKLAKEKTVKKLIEEEIDNG